MIKTIKMLLKGKSNYLLLYATIFYSGIALIELSTICRKEYLSILGLVLIVLSILVYSVIDKMFFGCISKKGDIFQNIDLIIKIIVIAICSINTKHTSIHYLLVFSLILVNIIIIIIMLNHIDEWIDIQKAGEQFEYFKELLKDNKLTNRVFVNSFIGMIFIGCCESIIEIVVGAIIYSLMSLYLIYYFYNKYYNHLHVFLIIVLCSVTVPILLIFDIYLPASMIAFIQSFLPIFLLKKVTPAGRE